MSLDNLKRKVETTKGKGKPSEYNTWRACVLEKYPNVFFATLSPAKNKILKAVVQRLQQETEYTFADFAEWIVHNWPKLSQITSINAFSKYEYPELDLVLYNYPKLINFYIVARTQIQFKPAIQKKKIDLSFLNER